MDGNQGDEGEGIDRHEPSAPAASASQMSPSEFVLAARRRKGLDPTRLTDQPDTADEQGQLGQPSAAAGHTDGSAFAGQVRVPWEVPYKWSLALPNDASMGQRIFLLFRRQRTGRRRRGPSFRIDPSPRQSSLV